MIKTKKRKSGDLIPVEQVADLQVGDILYLSADSDILNKLGHLYPSLVVGVRSPKMPGKPGMNLDSDDYLLMIKFVYADGSVAERSARNLFMYNPIGLNSAPLWIRERRNGEKR